MSSPIVAVAKPGKNVLTATDPNDFIFHSNYNTFKIILEGTLGITIPASTTSTVFTQTHGLSFTPLVTAFAKQNTAARVLTPNGKDISGFGVSAGIIEQGVDFLSVASDSTTMYFTFANSNGTTRAVTIKYYCLEDIAP